SIGAARGVEHGNRPGSGGAAYVGVQRLALELRGIAASAAGAAIGGGGFELRAVIGDTHAARGGPGGLPGAALGERERSRTAAAGGDREVHVLLTGRGLRQGGVGNQRRSGELLHAGDGLVPGLQHGGSHCLVHVGARGKLRRHGSRHHGGADGSDGGGRGRGYCPVFSAGGAVVELENDFVIAAVGRGAFVGHELDVDGAGGADRYTQASRGDGFVVRGGKCGPGDQQRAVGGCAVGAVHHV